MQKWKFDTVQVTQQQIRRSLLWLPPFAALFPNFQIFYNLVSEPDTVDVA